MLEEPEKPALYYPVRNRRRNIRKKTYIFLKYVIIRDILKAQIKRGALSVKYSELEKELRRIKCTVYWQGANHTIWYSPVTGKLFPVARHRTEDVPAGTLKSIMRDAGLK